MKEETKKTKIIFKNISTRVCKEFFFNKAKYLNIFVLVLTKFFEQKNLGYPPGPYRVKAVLSLRENGTFFTKVVYKATPPPPNTIKVKVGS